jgi:large subunit ribosomal protein L22
MSVESSLAQMQFLTKRGAEPVAKLIKSAAANANHNYGVKSKNLIVKNIFVTQAATYKRGKAVSRGRYFRIMRRGSNLNIELAQI